MGRMTALQSQLAVNHYGEEGEQIVHGHINYKTKKQIT